MPVITVTITESDIQLLSGIPKFVTLATNIPSTIFYTLDGTDPTTASLVYLGGELTLPTNQTTVIFKVFATDGTDSSAIIERTYRPDITILRQSHDQVTGTNLVGNVSSDKFPYGDKAPSLPVQWGSFGPNSLIVDKPGTPNMFDGYDGTATGTVSGGTDLTLEEYQILFSERNALGERGRGIGTLPAQNAVIDPAPPPVSSNMNDKFFDPRAMVIFQDSREEPFDPELLQINRQFFSLEDSNSERIKDGILLSTTALEGLAPTGSFVRAHFNPRDNTTTYYYHDSQTLRWIISKEPTPVQNPRTGIFNIMFSSRRSPGDRHVFRWIPFKGSRII
jgi:hypothetical protein